MKSSKFLIVLGILSMIWSCQYHEDSVAFFIDNQISETFTLQNSNEEVASDSVVHTISLDLTPSEAYARYLRGLQDIDITNFSISIVNNEGRMYSGSILIDDMMLCSVDQSSDHILVESDELLDRIEELFVERRRIVCRKNKT